MRKEILMAIIAGGTLGLLIAFAIWKGNSFIAPRKDVNPTPIDTVTLVASPTPSTKELKIVLTKPIPNSVFTQSKVTIAGVTSPNAQVVIAGETSDTTTQANDTGSFTADIDLDGGINQLTLFAFDPTGNQTTSTLQEVYSGQFEPKSDASTSAIAYIGTVTDITNSIIQIKNDTGDIQQINATNNATLVDSRNDTTKQIKLTDIAIGDFLFAMGYKDGNNILDATRVVITDPLTKPDTTAIFATVTDDTPINKDIVKTMKDDKTYTITPALGISFEGGYTNFGQVKKEDKLIVIGTLKDDLLTARTIKILK